VGAPPAWPRANAPTGRRQDGATPEPPTS
jgi:hypothetical protein